MSHHCHALACHVEVPPARHMCGKHWRMVPGVLKRNLLKHYRQGQENDMRPSPRYLRAAAACVRAVAEKERLPEEAIERECRLYTIWADNL